jgi:uncharacterized protein
MVSQADEQSEATPRLDDRKAPTKPGGPAIVPIRRSLRSVAAAAAVAVLAAACAGAVPTPPIAASAPAPNATAIPLSTELPASISHDDAMRLFEYDHSLPFAFRDDGVKTQDGAALHSFDYLDMAGKRKRAILVLPPGTGPFGAVTFLPGGISDRTEFQLDAIELAGHGVASLLIDPPELYAVPATDREAVSEMIFEMRELRRLVDWLASQPEVDPHRLGLVGVSYGAVRAATFAGVEGGRLKIAVLMSTPPSYKYAPMAPFDPIVWAPYVAPCALYIQEGTQDQWFTNDEAESLVAAAHEPKRLVWYEAGHGLNNQASTDFHSWLVAALGSA